MNLSTMLSLYAKKDMGRLALNYNKEMALLVKWLGPFSFPSFSTKEKTELTRLDYTYAFYELSKIFHIEEEILILVWRWRNKNG